MSLIFSAFHLLSFPYPPFLPPPSFSISKDYFLLVEQPLGVSVPNMLKLHFQGKALARAMDWLPGKKVGTKTLSI